MELYRKLYRELVLTTRPFEMQLNEILQEQGIHRSDWSVLYYLIHDPHLAAADIAKCLGIEKPNVTRTIKNLMSMNYVKVTPSKEDGRKKDIMVTQKGHEMYEEVRIYVDLFERETMQGLSEEQQFQFLDTLTHIQQNLIERAKKK
ncbi:MarR family winged helix-turn-helix transcriptional regulator [Kurthia massiliensis]|uniref:MarR family winged helix-turn-helix transcriptional regulator n=1 Tax=Kurthia massiliensis TaxID=1033739 RepID=UPI000288EF78|nr:MarR family transcriptional regulator [Kurthia massiliensis]